MAGDKRSSGVEFLMQRALQAAKSRGAPEAFMQGKHVFLVDDDHASRERVLVALRSAGGEDLDISTARTAPAAIEICHDQDGAFDIVLLSDRLGDRDTGIKLLGMLRRAGLPRHARTILYSKAMDRTLRERALTAGFDDTIHTDDIGPFALRELLAWVVSRTAPPAASGR